MQRFIAAFCAAAAVAALAVGLFWAAPAVRAQQAGPSAGTPWLHVEVIGGDDDRVGVNVPLAVAEIALRIAPIEKIREGRLKLEDKDISIADLRALWAELRKAGDGEFVKVESDDETVTVRREGDLLLVRVNKQGEAEEVAIDAPVDVVDALLSGDGEELDLLAAVRRLGERRGEVVRVRDGDESVRVWIDARL